MRSLQMWDGISKSCLVQDSLALSGTQLNVTINYVTCALKPIYFISGDFTLDINPVTLEDDATFQCQVSSSYLSL